MRLLEDASGHIPTWATNYPDQIKVGPSSTSYMRILDRVELREEELKVRATQWFPPLVCLDSSFLVMLVPCCVLLRIQHLVYMGIILHESCDYTECNLHDMRKTIASNMKCLPNLYMLSFIGAVPLDS